MGCEVLDPSYSAPAMVCMSKHSEAPTPGGQAEGAAATAAGVVHDHLHFHGEATSKAGGGDYCSGEGASAFPPVSSGGSPGPPPAGTEAAGGTAGTARGTAGGGAGGGGILLVGGAEEASSARRAALFSHLPRGHATIITSPEVVLPDYEGELWAEWDDAEQGAKT